MVIAMPIRITSRRSKEAPQLQKPVQMPFGLPVAPVDWVQREAGISLCMIVKNEEAYLAGALPTWLTR